MLALKVVSSIKTTLEQIKFAHQLTHGWFSLKRVGKPCWFFLTWSILCKSCAISGFSSDRTRWEFSLDREIDFCLAHSHNFSFAKNERWFLERKVKLNLISPWPFVTSFSFLCLRVCFAFSNLRPLRKSWSQSNNYDQ